MSPGYGGGSLDQRNACPAPPRPTYLICRDLCFCCVRCICSAWRCFTSLCLELRLFALRCFAVLCFTLLLFALLGNTLRGFALCSAYLNRVALRSVDTISLVVCCFAFQMVRTIALSVILCCFAEQQLHALICFALLLLSVSFRFCYTTLRCSDCVILLCFAVL